MLEIEIAGIGWATIRPESIALAIFYPSSGAASRDVLDLLFTTGVKTTLEGQAARSVYEAIASTAEPITLEDDKK